MTPDRRSERWKRALRRVHTEPQEHVVALVLAVVVGLGLAWVHWLGLVIAGALIGLVSPTLPRAVASGLGFGLLVLLAFAISLGDSAWRVLEMSPVVYVVVASALGLPAFGALSRGLV